MSNLYAHSSIYHELNSYHSIKYVELKDKYTLHLLNKSFSYSILRKSLTHEYKLRHAIDSNAYEQFTADGCTIMNSFVPISKYTCCNGTWETLYSNIIEIPISYHFTISELIKKKENYYIVAKLMALILKGSAKTLDHGNFVHGSINIDTILYCLQSNKALFFDCQYAKSIEHSQEEGFQISNKSIFYPEEYKNRKLFAAEAVTAEIKALVLSVYCMGFLEPFDELTYMNPLNSSLDVEKILKNKNHVLYKTQNQPGKLLNFLSSILISKSNDLSYKSLILDKWQSQWQLVYNESQLIKPTALKDHFKTTLFSDSTRIVWEIAKHVFLIESEDKLPYVIKRFAKINSYNKEKVALDRIKSHMNCPSLIKSMNNIVCANNELAVQYGGMTLSYFLYYNNIDIIVINLLKASVFHVMESLSNAHIFHCDIKPDNISVSVNSDIKMFDYDNSCILDENKPTDSVHQILIKGTTRMYASPEVLYCLIHSSSAASINPFRADEYSYAKSIFAAITSCNSELVFLRKFYNLRVEDKEHMMQRMEEAIVNKEWIVNRNALFSTRELRIPSIFYYEMNDVFLQNAQSYINPSVPDKWRNNYGYLIDVLILMMKTDLAKRPSITDLVDYTNIFSDSGNTTECPSLLYRQTSALDSSRNKPTVEIQNNSKTTVYKSAYCEFQNKGELHNPPTTSIIELNMPRNFKNIIQQVLTSKRKRTLNEFESDNKDVLADMKFKKPRNASINNDSCKKTIDLQVDATTNQIDIINIQNSASTVLLHNQCDTNDTDAINSEMPITVSGSINNKVDIANSNHECQTNVNNSKCNITPNYGANSRIVQGATPQITNKIDFLGIESKLLRHNFIKNFDFIKYHNESDENMKRRKKMNKSGNNVETSIDKSDINNELGGNSSIPFLLRLCKAMENLKICSNSRLNSPCSNVVIDSSLNKNNSYDKTLIESNINLIDGIQIGDFISAKKLDSNLEAALLEPLIKILRNSNNANLLNCDITPEKIKIGSNWSPVLICDKESSIFVKYEFDSEQLITLSSFSPVFDSPEMLRCALESLQERLINPLKSSIYSLSKIIICFLTRCECEYEIANKFYGLNARDYTEMITQMEKSLETQIMNGNKMDKSMLIRVQFSIEKKILVENIRKYDMREIAGMERVQAGGSKGSLK